MQAYQSLYDITDADIFERPGVKTPAFVRFTTVAGSRIRFRGVLVFLAARLVILGLLLQFPAFLLKAENTALQLVTLVRTTSAGWGASLPRLPPSRATNHHLAPRLHRAHNSAAASSVR